MNNEAWNVYRTRFLIRARQLTSPLAFTDFLGREHVGRPGDYLVESSDGSRRITPRQIFEDVYVPMASGSAPTPATAVKEFELAPVERRCLPRRAASA